MGLRQFEGIYKSDLHVVEQAKEHPSMWVTVKKVMAYRDNTQVGGHHERAQAEGHGTDPCKIQIRHHDGQGVDHVGGPLSIQRERGHMFRYGLYVFLQKGGIK